MSKIVISAEIPVADDQRANASLMHGLGPQIEALEAKIQELTGSAVRVEIGVKRTKQPKNSATILRSAAE